ncbi:MAG: hypothetical protein ABIH49_03640 [archaeon]
MISKRGQLTIFIIIGIVVIASAAVFFSVRNQIGLDFLGSETQPVSSFVQECVEKAGVEGIYSIGYGGGYLNVPEPSFYEIIPYYYLDGKNYMPEKEKIAEEISGYVDESVLKCTGNFSDFGDFQIEKGEISTSTRIDDNSVFLDVNFPLSVSKENNTNILKNFKAEIPVRLGVVYDSIAEVMDKQTEQGICLSCITNVDKRNDIYTDIYDFENRTKIIVFRDENSKINGEAFEFVFANKY